jgi:hypothetical protein
MKVHTTNYHNVFIEIADDCPAVSGEVPPLNGTAKTVANMQFELLHQNPYRLTSDDVLFQVSHDTTFLEQINTVQELILDNQ